MIRAITMAVTLAVLTTGSVRAAPPAAAMVTRDDAGNLVVSWSDPNPVDVFVSDRPDARFSRAAVISTNDMDGRDVLVSAGPARQYFLLRDTQTGETVRVAERVLPLERGSNFRDIGGYPTASGRHVKWGLIFRSGATPLITEADAANIKALGLVDMIDLRSSEERILAPTRLTGIRYSAFEYSMAEMMPKGGLTGASSMVDLYRTIPQFLVPQLRIVFSDLLANTGPVMYHCSAGQDRTGVTTAIVLSALGVPRDTILADYHLSTTYRHPQFEMPPISSAMAETNSVARMFASYQNAPGANVPKPLKAADGKAFLDGAFAEIDSRWGSVDGFLIKEIGLTPGQIEQLRRNYTE